MDKARHSLRVAGFLGILAWSSAGALAQAPALGVTGGLSVLDYGHEPKMVPGVVTWGSKVELTGSNWPPLENLSIHLVGPLNTPGLQPVDREVYNLLYPLNAFPTDLQGNLHGRFGMPY